MKTWKICLSNFQIMIHLIYHNDIKILKTSGDGNKKIKTKGRYVMGLNIKFNIYI